MAKTDVEIQGGGDLNGAVFKNAATEATLKKLVEIMDKKQKGMGDKIQEIYNKVLNKNIEATEETIDMQESYQKTLSESRTTLEKFGDALTDATKAGVSGLFTGIVATGTALVNFFKAGFDAFEETNKVGASFNYDLLELRRTAVAAAMPLEDFTKFVKENSVALAAFGGTVTEGAKRFATFREEFTDPSVNKELYNLGFNSESLNKIMAEQLKTEMVSGRSRELNSATFTRELKDYTKDLNKLSKVTGISTEQLQAGVTQQMADGKMMSLGNKLAGKALMNFREGLALMNAELDPKVFDTIKNMMSGVIDPADKFGAMLAVAAPGILEFNRAIGKGQLSVDQQVDGYKRQEKQLTLFLRRFSDEQKARIPELKAMEEYLSSIKKFTDGNGKAEIEGQKAMDGIIGLFSSFGEILKRVRNLFLKAFVDSGTMTRVQEAFKNLAAFIQEKGPLIIKRLEPVMTEIGNWIDKVVNGLIGFGEAFMKGELKPENIWKWVKDTFGGAIKVISDAIGAVFSGLMGTTPEQQAQKQAYAQATPEEQEKMRQQNPSLAMPNFGGMFDSMASGLKSLVDMVPTLKDLAIFFGVVGGGSFVAGLGLAAGISAVATAMAGLSVPALAVGAAIGMGAGGLGYALNGVANIINSVTDGFGKLGNFFKTMGESDPAKMQNAATSIKTLSGAMSDLAASGLVGLITGGTLSSLADTLTKFASIDYNKFSSAGTALGVLHDGLTKFTGGVMDSITGFFSTDGGLETVIKSLTKLNEIDLSKLQGVSALGTFFDSIKPFLDPNYVTKLPDSLKSIKQALDDFSLSIGSSVNNLSGNTGFLSVVESFKQLGSLSSSIATSNLGAGIDLFVENVQKFNNIDTVKIDNVVSAVGKVKTTLGEDFINQSAGVENFTKSIDGLVESLKKLEEQLKVNATLPRVTTNTSGDQQNNGQMPFPVAENSSSDILDQINKNIIIMNTQLLEIKNNTKDTSDSVSGRRSAL